MRGFRALWTVAAVSGLLACSAGNAGSEPEELAELGATEQAIIGGCSLAQVGAPCDPDGSGPRQECEGVCTLRASGGTVPVTVQCVPLSAASTSNNGKVCGTSAGAAGNCNQVCQGSLCVAKPAPNGTACRPSDSGADTLCDGQCTIGSDGTSSCQRINAPSRCPIERPATGAFNTDCVWDFCSATAATSCVQLNIPSGARCNDNNACTTSDRCNGAGACTSPTVRSCPSSGTPCLDNKCEPSTGACVATPTSAACAFDKCFAGLCAGGSCQKGAPISCDDGNACTIDSCDATFGCTHAPKCPPPSNACVIGSCNPTTGACNTVPRTCNDGNPCTFDSCNPASGCVFTPIPGCGFDAGMPDAPPPLDTGVPPFDTGVPPFDTGTPVFDSGTIDFDTGFIEEDTGVFFDGDIIDDGLPDTAVVDDAAIPEGGLGFEEDLSRGGCGCRTTSNDRSTAGLFAFSALALAIAVRRRRS